MKSEDDIKTALDEAYEPLSIKEAIEPAPLGEIRKLTNSIPQEGWFFDINTHGGLSKVYLDGKLVGGIQSVDISVSAGEVSKARVTMAIPLAKIRAKVEKENVEVKDAEE